MPSPRVGNIERQDSESEHIGPDYTGDNISAKKSANYVWNSGSSLWERMTQPGGSGGGDGAIVDGVNTAIKATVLDLTTSNPLTVGIVDGTGTQITSFGGGTQYTEGDVDASITGTATMWEDSGDTLRAVSAAKPLPVNIISNQSDEYGFQTTANLLAAAVYNSGVLSLSPEFSQVQTHILASANGTIDIYWYSDAGGTDQIRTLQVAYLSSTGFQMFAAPAFSPYVKYTFTNTGANQTDFYFDTKFLTKAINGQVLRVDGTISTTMVGNLTRSIISGETTAGGGAFVNVKVNPSGSLEVGTVATVTSITNPVTVTATDLDVRNLVFATDKVDTSGSTLAANSGVDIGDVTINNAAGASAVNIQDGGNTITVDGTVDTELPTAAALSDTDSAVPTTPTVGAFMMIANANASSANRARGMGNGLNSVGTGLQAAGLVAQFDDVTPTAITENSFGNVRISSNRNLYNTIRDAAGNERGVNVTAGNALTVDASATTQPVSLVSVPSHAVTNAGTFAVQDTSTTTTSTQTSVANSITNVTLLSLNASRKSATIYNDDTAASLYVKFGTTASATSFKIKIAPGGYYEFPMPIYTGRVDGIATAATGSARICEES